MRLRIELRSDTAFGRGDGIAGLVDSEVEHDARTGLPFVKGRTIKGLLVESCADLLFALEAGQNPVYDELTAAAQNLFGRPGSTLEDTGCLHIGPGRLPDDLRQHLTAKHPYTPQQVLQAFTAIRHQTAVDTSTDTPAHGTLRATRVVIRGTVFYADLLSDVPLNATDEQLLAACAAGVKRGGQNRTRGLGWLKLQIEQANVPQEQLLAAFIQRIGGAA